MKDLFVQTRNYTKIYEAITRLKSLPITADRMGLAYGNFGLGKSFSLEKIAADEGALLLRSDQTWSVSSVLKLLCQELDIDSSGRSNTLFNRVVDALLYEPRLIVIDEIDTLLRGGKYEVFELFRDIHDKTKNIIFFIGMDEALAKIKRHKHYFSRLTEIVKFMPISKEDIARFCELSEVKIEDDLIEYFTKKYPNLRTIKVFLLRLEEWALFNEKSSINYKDFKDAGVER